MKRFFISLLFLLLAFDGWAEGLESRDKEAISSTITTLFDSLQNGDTEVAYSMNTEETRESFGSPANYLATIKESYLPLYRHDLASIVDMSTVKDEVAVSVLIVDHRGAEWMAVFLMKRHSAQWQIESCHVGAAATLNNKDAI